MTLILFFKYIKVSGNNTPRTNGLSTPGKMLHSSKLKCMRIFSMRVNTNVIIYLINCEKSLHIMGNASKNVGSQRVLYYIDNTSTAHCDASNGELRCFLKNYHYVQSDDCKKLQKKCMLGKFTQQRQKMCCYIVFKMQQRVNESLSVLNLSVFSMMCKCFWNSGCI